MTDTVPTSRTDTVRLRLLTGAGVLVLLGGWAVASLAAGAYFIPAPWTTIADTAILLASGFTWSQILITFLRVCAGFLAGFLTGLAAGMAMGARRELDALWKPLVFVDPPYCSDQPPMLTDEPESLKSSMKSAV